MLLVNAAELASMNVLLPSVPTMVLDAGIAALFTSSASMCPPPVRFKVELAPIVNVLLEAVPLLTEENATDPEGGAVISVQVPEAQ